MTKRMPAITVDEFRKVIPQGTPQDDETHHAWGAVLYWHRDGNTYVEHQPDIGAPRRFVMATLTPEHKLDNLINAELQNILEMSDEEAIEEAGGVVDCTSCGWHGFGGQLIREDGGCPECGEFGTAVVPQ